MISTDKKYRTVDGREVRIYAVDGGGVFPVHGAIWNEVHNLWESRCWPANGCFGGNSIGDLVEVKPRIRREMWMNVYRDPEVAASAFPRRSEADLYAGLRIACIPVTIDCEVGEGL